MFVIRSKLELPPLGLVEFNRDLFKSKENAFLITTEYVSITSVIDSIIKSPKSDAFVLNDHESFLIE